MLDPKEITLLVGRTSQKRMYIHSKRSVIDFLANEQPLTIKSTHIRYIYVKKNATMCKICASF